MSSITVGELKIVLSHYPDDAEVIMNIRHNYDILEEVGKKGWIAYINGIKYDEEYNEVKIMN